MERLSLRLTAIAVRLRRTVVEQFVRVKDGPWIPAALNEQKDILTDIDALVPELERLGGKSLRYALAARESLWSNMVALGRWQTSWRGKEPLTEHLGPVDASHHDLWGAASLLALSASAIGDMWIRRRANSLGTEIMRLREEARAALPSSAEALQALPEDARDLWVLTGRLP